MVVIVARKQKGSKSKHTASKKEVSDTNCQFSELSSTLTKMKARINSIIGKTQGTNSSEANEGQEAPVSGYSGNVFGVHVSKRPNT